jgi:hypothetical protein
MKIVNYLLLLAFVSCTTATKKEALLFSFPKKIKEVSGIKTVPNSETLNLLNPKAT